MDKLWVGLAWLIAMTLSSWDVYGEEWYESHECLTENILMEARSEGEVAMMAVASVTLNRVRDRKFPDTVCDVVYQPWQFSWTFMEDEMTPLVESYERDIINVARSIAADALTYNLDDVTNGALWYHRHDVKPIWRKAYTVSAIIGSHIFYH